MAGVQDLSSSSGLKAKCKNVNANPCCPTPCCVFPVPAVMSGHWTRTTCTSAGLAAAGTCWCNVATFPSSGQLVSRLGQFTFYWIYCSHRPLFIKIQAAGHCLDIAWLESGDRADQCNNSVILFSRSQTKRQLRHRSGVFVQSVCPCVKCEVCTVWRQTKREKMGIKEGGAYMG